MTTVPNTDAARDHTPPPLSDFAADVGRQVAAAIAVSGLTVEQVAERAHAPAVRIRECIELRSAWLLPELLRVARVVGCRASQWLKTVEEWPYDPTIVCHVPSCPDVAVGLTDYCAEHHRGVQA